MGLKTGYKQTEAGVIPVDWDVSILNELIEKDRTIRYGIVQPGRFDPNGRYLVRGQDYSFGWVDSNKLFKVSEQVESRYKKARLNSGDIIITIVGAGTGHVEIVPIWLQGSNITQTTARIPIDSRSTNAKFCKYYLQSYEGKSQISLHIKGAAQPGLNVKDVRTFKIPLPSSLDEQNAIVSVVSNAENLIQSLEKIINKKQLIKLGAMQELLVGKKRLQGFDKPGKFIDTQFGRFPSGWEIASIGELLDFKNGLNKAKHFFGNGNPIVNYMDVFDNPGLLQSDINGKVDVTQDEIRNYKVNKGDVLFTRTSETVEEIGLSSTILEDIQNAVFSGFVLRGRPKNEKLNLNYTKYCFRSEIVRKQIVSTCSYTTRALTNGKLLSKVYIPFPASLEEQAAIASVLTDMENEINALEIKLAKYKQIKQGMMQNLLTGRIRLV
ncbi:hypothetical protein PAT3040_00392 [Paenibacillus agaridevorans]|uniref:Type I restriction modification DNA specificity domain-containing protein n=1 Tax=Paenibacillus agaridevorans TaxID=171404 RepID=A0A2R5EHC0_9BACL|nr:restriction endonuclease subunit S [Paenibacillus agaridevorans]GBG05907.1 hypothetical protein PAT3040_00392 [Paenibacillus agaridevorans]